MVRTLVLAFALALSIGSMAAAQGYDWRSVLSQSLKVQMKIDPEFEFSKERFVPIHFTMAVPFSEGDLLTRTRFLQKEGNLGELQFLSPDEQLMEFVTFSTGTVGGDTPDERSQRLFNLIEQQVYPSLGAPENANVLGGRRAEVAGRPAVEFLSLFNDPIQGEVAARIVGVIAPDDHGVVFFIQQTMRERMGLTDPNELGSTFAGSMLASLTFQAYRNEAGDLVEF